MQNDTRVNCAIKIFFLSGACAIAAKDEFDNTAVKEINNKDLL